MRTLSLVVADAMFNVQVKNAFKVFELTRCKWYLLQCHSDTERQQWLDALQLERQTVRIDADNSFNRPAFTSKVDVLHHRQQACSPGGTPGERPSAFVCVKQSTKVDLEK